MAIGVAGMEVLGVEEGVEVGLVMTAPLLLSDCWTASLLGGVQLRCLIQSAALFGCSTASLFISLL